MEKGAHEEVAWRAQLHCAALACKEDPPPPGNPALTQPHLMACSTADFALPAAFLPIPALCGALLSDQ